MSKNVANADELAPASDYNRSEWDMIKKGDRPCAPEPQTLYRFFYMC